MKMFFELILISVSCLAISTVKKTNLDLPQVIYIDPGHGGMDGGCVASDGTMEKDINLDISIYLRDVLVGLGYVVELTRIGDYDLASENAAIRKKEDIMKRCELMKDAKLFVSIHCNSYPGFARGAQSFYGNNSGKYLSDSIQEKLINVLNNTNRKSHVIKDKYILDNASCPGCIVEVGFLSNEKELKLLKNEDYQKQVAYAIALGIENYIKNMNL